MEKQTNTDNTDNQTTVIHGRLPKRQPKPTNKAGIQKAYTREEAEQIWSQIAPQK